jgi:hypothetical protein
MHRHHASNTLHVTPAQIYQAAAAWREQLPAQEEADALAQQADWAEQEFARRAGPQSPPQAAPAAAGPSAVKAEGRKRAAARESAGLGIASSQAHAA